MYQRLFGSQLWGLLSRFFGGFGTDFEAVAVVSSFEERAIERHWFKPNGECNCGWPVEQCSCHFCIAEDRAHSLKLRLVVMITLVRS